MDVIFGCPVPEENPPPVGSPEAFAAGCRCRPREETPEGEWPPIAADCPVHRLGLVKVADVGAGPGEEG